MAGNEVPDIKKEEKKKDLIQHIAGSFFISKGGKKKYTRDRKGYFFVMLFCLFFGVREKICSP